MGGLSSQTQLLLSLQCAGDGPKVIYWCGIIGAPCIVAAVSTTTNIPESSGAQPFTTWTVLAFQESLRTSVFQIMVWIMMLRYLWPSVRRLFDQWGDKLRWGFTQKARN